MDRGAIQKGVAPYPTIWNLLLFRMVHRLSFLLLSLFCSHPFFGLNALLISGVNPLLRTLVRKYAEGKGPMAGSVCGSTTWSKGLLFPIWLPSNKRERLLLWGVQHWSGLFGRYESTLKSWIRLYFPTYAWEKAAPTMKTLLLNSGNSKNELKVYVLDDIIQLWKVEFLFWTLSMIESSRVNFRLCLKLPDFCTLNFKFEKLNSFFSTSQQPLRVAAYYAGSGC